MAEVLTAPGGLRARWQLQRADTELAAARAAAEPWERYSHAHLAALRAATALVESRPRPARRRGAGLPTAWDLLGRVEPDLADWARYFADNASLRAAIDAGRFDAVSAQRAVQAVQVASHLVELVARRLDGAGAVGAGARGADGEGAVAMPARAS